MERKTDERIVKIPLPLGLIREIDESIVAGLGGYSTRTEFFRDAAEGLLFELKYEPAPAEPVPHDASHTYAPDRHVSATEPLSRSVSPTVDRASREPAFPSSLIDGLAATALRLEAEGEPVAEEMAEVDDEPLFGMHNRDYPSLWVAFRLAARTAVGPVPYEPFVDEVTEEAWDYANALLSLEESTGRKLTALFPTNRAKPQSAADGFKAFAIGSVAVGEDSARAEGPLFSWRICQVQRAPDGHLLLGLTMRGWRLLRDLDGITLETPHSPELARTFLHHLREQSPGDWWGFSAVLSAVAAQPTRVELLEAFRGERPDWSSGIAATNAQGYIARAREWGLVQPKQLYGRYSLTDFVAQYLAEVEANN
jgi:hypothetical protein